jgi:hypothetical protein
MIICLWPPLHYKDESCLNANRNHAVQPSLLDVTIVMEVQLMFAICKIAIRCSVVMLELLGFACENDVIKNYSLARCSLFGIFVPRARMRMLDRGAANEKALRKEPPPWFVLP